MAKDVGGRGEDDVPKDVGGRGGAQQTSVIVEEIFGRMKDLGGWLVVSFIAPVPASGAGGGGGLTARSSRFANLARIAEQRDAEDNRKLRELVEAQIKTKADSPERPDNWVSPGSNTTVKE